MKVTLKTLQQETFQIEVEDGWKVKDLKEKIESMKGAAFPASGQKLIYSGKILADDQEISEYNITEANFIVIMVSKPKSAPKTAAPAAAPATTTASTAAAPAPAAQPAATATQPSPASSTPSATSESASTTTQPSQDATDSGGADLNAAAAEQALLMGREFEGMVNQICQMGFDAQQVRIALRASFNNPDRAVEYLMSGIPDSVRADLGIGEGTRQETATTSSPAQPAGSSVSPSVPAVQSPAPPTAQESAPAPSSSEGPTDTATAFAALRDMPQFHHVRQVVRQNPNMLPALLQQIGQQNPSLLTMISQNQQAFIDMMNESDDGSAPAPQAPAGGEGVVGGQGQAGDDYRVMYVTAEEKEAIERLKALGFEEHKVVEAYFACDKNENLAANYLLQSAYDE